MWVLLCDCSELGVLVWPSLPTRLTSADVLNGSYGVSMPTVSAGGG